MRTALLCSLVLSVFAIAACGDDDGGGLPATPDANFNVPDAGGGGGGVLDVPSWSNTQCSQEAPTCTDSGSNCISITQGATTGFCVPDCFAAPDGTNPTDAAHMACASAFNGTIGEGTSVGCVVSGPAEAGVVTWTCLVFCEMETDCNEALTCTQVGETNEAEPQPIKACI